MPSGACTSAGWGGTAVLTMQTTIRKTVSRDRGRCLVRPPGVAVVVMAALVASCTPAPQQEALTLVRRLGGRATAGGQSNIARIDLAHTAVTDDELARLAALGGGPNGPLGRLEELDLTHTGITDRGIESLAGFPAVRKLSLTLTQVTDAGLAPLSALEHLTELYLIETRLTDAAVEPLSRLRQLQTLVLLRTGVSDAGIERLRRALPRTRIQIEPAAARSVRRAP